MMGLTQRQTDALEFIKAYVSMNHGVAPSLDEIRVALDLSSKASIIRLLDALEERGFIRRLPNRARAIEVVQTAQSIALPHHTFAILSLAAAHDGVSREELVARLVVAHAEKIGLPGLADARSDGGENIVMRHKNIAVPA